MADSTNTFPSTYDKAMLLELIKEYGDAMYDAALAGMDDMDAFFPDDVEWAIANDLYKKIEGYLNKCSNR